MAGHHPRQGRPLLVEHRRVVGEVAGEGEFVLTVGDGEVQLLARSRMPLRLPGRRR
ncbi:hypothetical protein [Streptomyces sp. NPDC001276]|uniref:hypothetical protein n=1 Tax=unclassified Streptomyces TaxID=2593676 RepID=UPI0036947AAD